MEATYHIFMFAPQHFGSILENDPNELNLNKYILFI